MLLAFIPMYLLGVTSNIMSIAGIAISIGVLVDGAIVEVENAYKKLELWHHGGRKGTSTRSAWPRSRRSRPRFSSRFWSSRSRFSRSSRSSTRRDASSGRSPTRRRSPWGSRRCCALTLDPAIADALHAHGPVLVPSALPGAHVERRHGRHLLRGGEAPHQPRACSPSTSRCAVPCCGGRRRRSRWRSCSWRQRCRSTCGLGREFMPPLDEGTLLYMPITLPGVSVTEMAEAAPDDGRDAEGHARGRARLRKGGARGDVDRPGSALDGRNHGAPEATLGMAAGDDAEKLEAELHEKLQFPGVTNAFVMPIRNRIDMLATGIRTPVGVKVFGPDLKTIENLGRFDRAARCATSEARAACSPSARRAAISWTST